MPTQHVRAASRYSRGDHIIVVDPALAAWRGKSGYVTGPSDSRDYNFYAEINGAPVPFCDHEVRLVSTGHVQNVQAHA